MGMDIVINNMLLYNYKMNGPISDTFSFNIPLDPT